LWSKNVRASDTPSAYPSRNEADPAEGMGRTKSSDLEWGPVFDRNLALTEVPLILQP
jgi:hypothetical protein